MRERVVRWRVLGQEVDLSDREQERENTAMELRTMEARATRVIRARIGGGGVFQREVADEVVDIGRVVRVTRVIGGREERGGTCLEGLDY